MLGLAVYIFIVTEMRTICPAHHIILHLIIASVLGELRDDIKQVNNSPLVYRRVCLSRRAEGIPKRCR
jgi:hypothetical protein